MPDQNNEDLNSVLNDILSNVTSDPGEPLEMIDPDDDIVAEGIPMNDLISVKFIKAQFDSIDDITFALGMGDEGRLVKNVINAIIEHWEMLDDEKKLEWV